MTLTPSPCPGHARNCLSGDWSLAPKERGPRLEDLPSQGFLPCTCSQQWQVMAFTEEDVPSDFARITEQWWRGAAPQAAPACSRPFGLTEPPLYSQPRRSFRGNRWEGHLPKSLYWSREIRGPNDAVTLSKCCTQYASKSGKLSSGHRTGQGQFSFQSLRKAMPKNAQTTAQLHSSHTLVK